MLAVNVFFSYQISVGQVVMANYNPDEPDERGYWYDVKITKKVRDLDLEFGLHLVNQLLQQDLTSN